MPLEGEITVELHVEAGRVRQVQVRSSRRVDACLSLVGQPVEGALHSVPLLFSVCAEAQSVAAREACEAALGIEPGDERRALRQLRVTCEAVDNHALQVALKWPELFGGQPAVQALRALREATLRLRTLAGESVPVREEEARAAARLVADRLGELLGAPLPAQLGELKAWRSGASTAQQAIAGLMREQLEDFGRCSMPLLPALPAGWFDAQTTNEPGFDSAPRYQGHPAETGALARHQRHLLISQLLAQHGNGLLTRFVARLVDLEALGARTLALAQILRTPKALAAPSRNKGRGAAVVETSRGTLAHVLAVEQGRVVGWRVVAPTEWNFHPQGPLALGLLGVQAQGVQRASALLMSGLDPCVGFEVRVRGS